MEKVLVIDDSKLEVKVLEDILREEYEVITALTGEEGVKKARTEAPALILLDIVMPGMDGFEILEILKGTDSTKEIPVVFLTALSDESTEEKGFMKGATDYIKKPFNPHIVRARVRTHVKLYLYMKTIETQMSVDGLTGAFNRRAFDEQKQRLWDKALIEQVPLSLFIVDIDFFKRVNDTYGHGEGDFVLKTTVNEMQKALLWEQAYLARYGGEEFAVLFYGKTAGESELIAEELRERIRKLNIPNIHSDVCPFLTVSIGGCTLIPADDRKVSDIVEIADNMLYQAKNSGRNRTAWKCEENGK